METKNILQNIKKFQILLKIMWEFLSGKWQYWSISLHYQLPLHFILVSSSYGYIWLYFVCFHGWDFHRIWKIILWIYS